MSSQYSFLVAALVLVAGISVAARLRSTRTAIDFQLAGRKVGVVTNACAICGDYVSAASFLGVAAAVYVAGLDGAWYATGFAAGFVPVLIFVAAPLRRFGERSLPDFLGRRFRSEPVRLVAVVIAQLVILAYLVPQAVGGGLTWELFTDLSLPGLTPYSTGIVSSTLLTGLLVIIGGMRGTTWNQALQFILLLAVLCWVAVALVSRGFDYGETVASLNAEPLMQARSDGASLELTTNKAGNLSATAEDTELRYAYFAQPGARYTGLGQIGLMVTLVFGTAGLPHVMNRFFTSPTGRAARMTTVWVLGLIGVFYALAVMVGTASRSLIATSDAVWLEEMTVDGLLNTPEHALLAMGRLFGGEFGLSVVTTGALMAIMSTIGGLLLAASVSWGHDVYEHHINPRATRLQALRAGQLAVALMTVGAAVVAVIFNPSRLSGSVPSVIASMVTSAFALAGCTLTPAIILGIWSRRVSAAGIISGMIVGAVASIISVAVGLLVDGAPILLQTPTLVLGPVVVGIMLAVSAVTSPVSDLGAIWLSMHGSASDREAERLAKATMKAAV